MVQRRNTTGVTRRDWMRLVGIASAGVAAPVPVIACADESETSGIPGNSAVTKPLSLVELFTSQGCSSCPPADRVLADLVNRHESEGLPAIGLSFHVDYWNYLGWRDPFSSGLWSQRQKRYASVLNDRVYTPQMIVNGQTGFVGSRRKQLDLLIGAAATRVHTHTIALEVKRDAARINVSYSVKGDGDGRLVNLSLVARSLTATATRGENAGRTLTHANVVRDFAVRRLEELDGAIWWNLPKETDTDYSVVAYVQQSRTAEITGVVAASVT